MSYPHVPVAMSNQRQLFRSEDMTLVQLYIPSELAHSTVSELGDLGLVEFRDLNSEHSSFQRTFVGEIRKLEEMDRRIRFLKAQCEKLGIPMKKYESNSLATKVRNVQETDELNAYLAELEAKITQMNSSQETLNKRFLELTEMRHVLRETAFYFEEAESRPEIGGGGGDYQNGSTTDDTDAPLLDRDEELATQAARQSRDVSLTFVAGIIPHSRMNTFERVLWRALRGNLYMNSSEIDELIADPVTGEQLRKDVFVVFAHGKELLQKIKKIAEGLGATIYPLDQSSMKRSEDMLEVTARIEDLNHVMYNTQATRRTELSRIAQTVLQWEIMVKKEKGVFHTMNLFNYDSTRKCLIAEGWCPSNAINTIQYALHAVSERSGSMVPPILNEVKTTLQPPTYHKTNKFTRGFQSIVDAYGIAKYKEVNPGLFTLITFPFLFALMFGDFGHGLIVTFAGIIMIWRERQLMQKNLGEIFETFFSGRYIILLMGLYSMYVGLIYNDVFSLPMRLFESSFTSTGEHGSLEKTNPTYPMGIDYAWREAENSLLFLNSYKMKMSIIIGVIHMTFGICLSVYNSRYFKKPMNIYCEFIPQVTFLLSIFGYLCVLIIYKWLHSSQWPNPTGAPQLLQTLIFMFLSPGSVDPKDQIYPGQAVIQVLLLLIAFICVPWMLCIKPYLLWRQHKQNLEAGYRYVEGDSPSAASHNSDVSAAHAAEMHGEKFDFGEIIVHQVIHTIEFCLGAISNTASYLRLWALSLAHAQLSEVLWDMTLLPGLNGGAVMMIICYYFWFGLTLGILVLMEGLSAFLHALRLHWVEFNGKFYEGSGVAFTPFSFAKIIKGVDS